MNQEKIMNGLVQQSFNQTFYFQGFMMQNYFNDIANKTKMHLSYQKLFPDNSQNYDISKSDKLQLVSSRDSGHSSGDEVDVESLDSANSFCSEGHRHSSHDDGSTNSSPIAIPEHKPVNAASSKFLITNLLKESVQK